MPTNSNPKLTICMNYLKSKFLRLYLRNILVCSLVFVGCAGNGQDSTETDDKTIPDSLSFEIQAQTKAKYKNIAEIPVPPGYFPVEADSNSFGFYLRSLELKTENNIVYYYNGSVKPIQSVHFAIIKMDVGTRDLQQCADAVMRLRGEYLWKQKRFKEIHFNFLGDGKPRYYLDYVKNDLSHEKFRKYMDYIFAYANTSSLHDELKPVNIDDVMPGDVFIQKGSPYGHAVIVTNVAVNTETGKKIFMLAQSFMPAQEIHILKNFTNTDLSPWYVQDFGETLSTPQWDFNSSDLMRFD